MTEGNLGIFTGPPVYLRRLDRMHLPAALRWIWEDPELLRFLSWRLPLNSLTTEEKWLEETTSSPDHQVFAIHDFATDEHIGVVGLHGIDWVDRKGELGIFVAAEWRERGEGRAAIGKLLTWAFQVQNLHRVRLYVWAYNERAKHLYEKLGFRREGILREAHYFNGRYWDEELWAILADEFRAGEKGIAG